MEKLNKKKEEVFKNLKKLDEDKIKEEDRARELENQLEDEIRA